MQKLYDILHITTLSDRKLAFKKHVFHLLLVLV